MRGSHIAGKFSPPGEVAPFRKRFKHTIGLSVPDKAVRAVGRFFTRGRRIEDDLYGIVVEVDGSKFGQGSPEQYSSQKVGPEEGYQANQKYLPEREPFCLVRDDSVIDPPKPKE